MNSISADVIHSLGRVKVIAQICQHCRFANKQKRSRHNASGTRIGDQGLLGRLLVRGERGCLIIPELTPVVGLDPAIKEDSESELDHASTTPPAVSR